MARAADPADRPAYCSLWNAIVLQRSPANNPTSEFIVPYIRGRLQQDRRRPGKYYLYETSHEYPGGICVAPADSSDDPFHEYVGNPLIDNSLPPATISHVPPARAAGCRHPTITGTCSTTHEKAHTVRIPMKTIMYLLLRSGRECPKTRA